MAPQTTMVERRREQVNRRWGWILLLGALFAVLGVAGLGMALTRTFASITSFGVLLVAGGVFHLLQIINVQGAKERRFQALIALLYLITASLIFADPQAAAIRLTLVLALMLLVVGILRIVSALDLRPLSGWVGLMSVGIAEVLLAVLVYIEWPVSGLRVIGLFVSIDLLLAGSGYITLALRSRRGHEAAA